MKEALKLALDLAIMHHSDDGYAELRSKVRQLAKEVLAQPQEPRNFCPRCGKRTADLTVIHTCTPPEGGAPMTNDFTLGVCGAIEPNITFLTNASKEVMRIDNNGVTINPEIPLDEAAQHVINALDEHIKHLVRSEREACASVVDKRLKFWATSVGKDKAYKWLKNLSEVIRARGNT